MVISYSLEFYYTSLVDGWAASSRDTEPYLQVDFEAIYDVTELQFTGTSSGWYTISLRFVARFTNSQIFLAK